MAEAHRNPDDAGIKALLEGARRIAVVGLSPKPDRDSNHIARYLLERGYQVVPVYPREQQILGQTVYRRVQDIPEPVDIVDVFRQSDDIPEVVEDALAAKAPALWLQLGCVHEGAVQKALAAGMRVVADHCIMVDHSRLLGRAWKR